MSKKKYGATSRLLNEFYSQNPVSTWNGTKESYYRAAGIHADTSKNHAKRHYFTDFKKKNNIVEPTKAPQEKEQWEETESGAKWEFTGPINENPKNITLDDVLKLIEPDLGKYEVDRWRWNRWSVTMKDPNGGAPVQVYNYQIRVDFKIKRFGFEDYLDLFGEVLEEHKDYVPKVKIIHPKSDNLLEIDIFDPHFGKYSDIIETGDPYDLTIATERYEHCIDTILNKAQYYKVSRILFPTGNDFFHFDNLNKTTTNGTPQDTNVRFARMYAHGVKVLLRNIDKLSSIAPVEVIPVLSNHDRESMITLANWLHIYFQNHPNVHVNEENLFKHRKYFRWGRVGLGFTHGDPPKIVPELPSIMDQEMRKEWGDVDYREWHIGHYHNTKEFRFKAVDTKGGSIVRYLRSISSTDWWHAYNGYIGAVKGAEGFIWHKEGGLEGILPANL